MPGASVLPLSTLAGEMESKLQKAAGRCFIIIWRPVDANISQESLAFWISFWAVELDTSPRGEHNSLVRGQETSASTRLTRSRPFEEEEIWNMFGYFFFSFLCTLKYGLLCLGMNKRWQFFCSTVCFVNQLLIYFHYLKELQVIETRAFPRIGYVLITAKTRVKIQFWQYLNCN